LVLNTAYLAAATRPCSGRASITCRVGEPCSRLSLRLPLALAEQTWPGLALAVGGHGCGKLLLLVALKWRPIRGPLCAVSLRLGWRSAGRGWSHRGSLGARPGEWGPADDRQRPVFWCRVAVLSLFALRNLWVLITAAACGPAGAADGCCNWASPGSASRSIMACCLVPGSDLIYVLALQCRGRTGSFPAATGADHGAASQCAGREP